MARRKVLRDYYTLWDISKRVGKSYHTINYHFKHGNLPKPKMILTYVRFIGNFVRTNVEVYWTSSQVNKIERDLKKVYKGGYPKRTHPITGKKIKASKKQRAHIRRIRSGYYNKERKSENG